MTRIIKFHIFIISLLAIFFILNNIGEGNAIVYINNFFLILFSFAYLLCLLLYKDFRK
jgi:hypothetical protein